VSVSITLYYEQTNEQCSVCGAFPAYRGIISSAGAQGKLEPRCLDCIISRVANGVIQEELQQTGCGVSTRRIKKLSQKQERRIMSDIGGRVQSASGAKNGYKGDGRLYNQIRMEAKFTFAKQFSLTRTILNKIRGECEGSEKPAVVIDFKNKFTGITEDSWVVIPYSEWKKTTNDTSNNS
jgi:hypothetical protein